MLLRMIIYRTIYTVFYFESMKELARVLALILALDLVDCMESYNVERLYRTLDVTCFDEKDLQKICHSQVAIV